MNETSSRLPLNSVIDELVDKKRDDNSGNQMLYLHNLKSKGISRCIPTLLPASLFSTHEVMVTLGLRTPYSFVIYLISMVNSVVG